MPPNSFRMPEKWEMKVLGYMKRANAVFTFSSLWKSKANLENKVCHYLSIPSVCAQVLVHGCGGQRSPFRSQVSPPPHGLLLRL